MTYGTREAFGSLLLRGIMDFVMLVTRNTWRRQSGGGAKRDAIVNFVIQRDIEACEEPPQLVVFPFKQSEISLEGTSLATAIDDEGSPDLPLNADGPNWMSVHQTLDYLNWDPTFTLCGFNYRKQSIWCLQLDLYPLAPYILARQFRQITGYSSAPGSIILVVYIDQPILQIAKACGFLLAFDRPLDSIARAEGLPRCHLRGVRIAKFYHQWIRPPTRKEMNMADIPSPREPLDFFLQDRGSDFSLLAPPRKLIKDIQGVDQTVLSTERSRPLRRSEVGVKTMTNSCHKTLGDFCKDTDLISASPDSDAQLVDMVSTTGNSSKGTSEVSAGRTTDVESIGKSFDETLRNKKCVKIAEEVKTTVRQVSLSNLESVITTKHDRDMVLSKEVGETRFTLRGQTHLADNDLVVLLIGSVAPLGCWQCSEALEMRREGNENVASVCLTDCVSEENPAEYKYALARYVSGHRQVVAWDEGENRALSVSNGEPVADVVDHPRSWHWV